MSEYLVDIPMCVYNHESYISQAIEGVINQKTDFKYRLIIGEDHSTDNSREIIQKYALKFPEIVFPLFHEQNLGPFKNSEILFGLCTSKYIALCDGDDYWMDATKLKKQVRFLESNQDFAICFHNARILNEQTPDQLEYSNPPDQKEVSTFEDLAKGEFIYTSTCLFRLDHFRRFPRESIGYINNYTLDLHNSQFGKIKYINEVMSTYRIHGGGMWSMVKRESTLITQLPTYKFYLEYFDRKYRKFFLKHLKDMSSELIFIKLANKDRNGFWKHYLNYAMYNLKSWKEFKQAAYILLKASSFLLKKD